MPAILLFGYYLIGCVPGPAVDCNTAPDELLILPGARDIQKQTLDDQQQVVYVLPRDYSPDDAVKAISKQLAQRGWEPAEESFVFPGMQTSRVEGWGSYTEGGTRRVYQWWSEWQNPIGETAAYILEYDCTLSDEECSDVRVSVTEIPTDHFEHRQKRGDNDDEPNDK